MRKITQILFIMMILSGLISCETTEQGSDQPESSAAKERSDIEDKYKWNLADLYPDLASWESAKEAIKPEFDKIAEYQGSLDKSGKGLYDALEFVFLHLLLSRLEHP